MLTAIVGVVGALIFGSADFLGGLAARRIRAVAATATAALTGLVGLLLALPFVGGAWSASVVLWGSLSGVSGALAISLLYACLAIGPMSILSPLTAVVSAIVPMTAGLLGGERLAPLGYWALGLALVAVVLVGFVPEKGAVRPSLKGILMAIGAGVAMGAFMILVDLTPVDSGLLPLVLNRGVNATITFAALGVIAVFAARRRVQSGTGASAATGAADALRESREPVIPSAPSLSGAATSTLAPVSLATVEGTVAQRRKMGILIAIASGLIDVVANTLLLIGIRIGDLSVMSVLTALYPAGTILLAALVLKERIAPVQWAGLALALTAAGMLALS
ncbi:EamA family transporter [Rathayibacter sp. YIM 133350]|uniref:EamA family transporter n=1 Tax=Rathayibacter sp. YIM 133350 TaxID=3131992 RepID=UPI00307ED25B